MIILEKRKKVLFVSFRGNPNGLGGGITTLVENASLLGKTYDIDIMTPFRLRQISDRHIKQHVFLSRNKKWNDFFILIYLIRAMTLFSRIHQDYSRIMIYLPNPSLAFIGDMFSMIRKSRIIIYYEGVIRTNNIIRSSKANIKNIMRLLANNRILTQITGRKNIYVVSSEFQKEQLKRFGYNEKNIHVIPNIPKSKPYYNKKAMIRKNNGRIITYIGHLNYEKGVDILIRSFLRAGKEINDCELHIITKSSRKSSYAKYILKLAEKSRNIFIQFGLIDVNALLAETDLIVLPYRTLAGTAMYPSCILEALNNNVPILSTRLHPLDEILPEENLIRMDRNYIETISGKIVALISDSREAGRIRIKQKNIYNRILNRKKMHKKLLEVLR